MASSFFRKVKLELLTDVVQLLKVQKRTRGGICHGVHWYAKDNNKYMKDFDKKTIVIS